MMQALVNGTVGLDGFSPIGGITVELSEAPETASLPLTAAASLDPLTSVGLFDLTPGDPAFGERVPFQLWPISMALPGQPEAHSLVLFPAIPLAPTHRYGLVVTGRALSTGGLPFGHSRFFAAALDAPLPGEASEVARVRALADEVLDGVGAVDAAFLADGVAVALRVSARSTDDIPRDPLRMKEQVLAGPPPAVVVTDVGPGSGPVAAVVSGTWEAPTWLQGPFLLRDVAGDPLVASTLALPQTALAGPVPVVMMQHGGGGTAEGDVPYEAEISGIAEAGFAMVGFTNFWSREIGLDQDTQNLAVFGTLMTQGAIPDFYIEETGEQIAFVRAIEELAGIDELPFPGGDGVPDLDLTAPLGYIGYSAGSVAGQALLPYAPEIRAAVLVAGATRITEQYVHQDQNGSTDFFRTTLPSVVPNVRPPDIWAGISMYQMGVDRQDPHNHAAFLRRNPIEVAGTIRKASVLVIEGLRDSSIPNSATRSLAWTAGFFPHLQPIREAVPFLVPTAGPVSANVDAETTVGFVQFVPAGIPGIAPSPGCEAEPEGHYCAQAAPGSRALRREFFETAISDPAPTIAHPEATP